nr:transposase [Massilimicrobiota sp. An134]
MFFTNLGEEFSAQEIIELYTYRWDIEVSYKTLKTDQVIICNELHHQ